MPAARATKKLSKVVCRWLERDRRPPNLLDKTFGPGIQCRIRLHSPVALRWLVAPPAPGLLSKSSPHEAAEKGEQGNLLDHQTFKDGKTVLATDWFRRGIG